MLAPTLGLRAALRLVIAAAFAVVTLVALSASASAASVSCSLYAAPNGSDGGSGGADQPFATAQKLVDTLRAGETGCLRGGTYSQSEVAFRHGGSAGAPLTLSSAPGETATIRGGIVYVPSGSEHVTLVNLHIDTAGAGQPGIQLMSGSTSLVGDDITNGSTKSSCIILGNNDGWGQARDTLIQDDVIHQCGSPGDGNQDHAIYFDNSVGAVINHNVIWGAAAYAIHLYESAQDSTITENVIADNGYGVIFAGSESHYSNGNVVERNIIAGARHSYDIESYFPHSVGHGNLAADNCLAGGRPQPITTVKLGFSVRSNVVADPMFADAAHHDYTLRSGSPCLGVLGQDPAASLGGQSLRVATVAATHPAPPRAVRHVVTRTHHVAARKVAVHRPHVAAPRHRARPAHRVLRHRRPAHRVLRHRRPAHRVLHHRRPHQ